MDFFIINQKTFSKSFQKLQQDYPNITLQQCIPMELPLDKEWYYFNIKLTPELIEQIERQLTLLKNLINNSSKQIEVKSSKLNTLTIEAPKEHNKDIKPPSKPKTVQNSIGTYTNAHKNLNPEWIGFPFTLYDIIKVNFNVLPKVSSFNIPDAPAISEGVRLGFFKEELIQKHTLFVKKLKRNCYVPTDVYIYPITKNHNLIELRREDSTYSTLFHTTKFNPKWFNTDYAWDIKNYHITITTPDNKNIIIEAGLIQNRYNYYMAYKWIHATKKPVILLQIGTLKFDLFEPFEIVKFKKNTPRQGSQIISLAVKSITKPSLVGLVSMRTISTHKKKAAVLIENFLQYFNFENQVHVDLTEIPVNNIKYISKNFRGTVMNKKIKEFTAKITDRTYDGIINLLKQEFPNEMKKILDFSSNNGNIEQENDDFEFEIDNVYEVEVPTID